MRIALAQLDPTVGDLDGNLKKLVSARDEAARHGADLVVFPELFVTGYPPEDLVLKPAFQQAARSKLEALAASLAPGPGVLVGTIWPDDGKLYNAVVLIDDGAIKAVRTKVDLPNYGVFDEKRVFAAGPLPGPILFRGTKIGVPICEDIWKDEVTECLEECGAEILLVPNGSPFDWKKPDIRLGVAVARVTETGLPLAYVNQVGGQDELVFDGASFVLNADRSLAAQLPAWREMIAITEWTKTDGRWVCAPAEVVSIEEGDAAAYSACVLGLRDYVTKNGFPGVVLGLSGGIDSAIVAAIAVDALGPGKVHAIMLPSRHTSDDSLTDAAACAKALGIRYDKISIEPGVAGLGWALKDLFAGTLALPIHDAPEKGAPIGAGMALPIHDAPEKGAPIGAQPDTTEENIQSRVRGTLLMAVSNKFGAMVVTTGNKSEMSVGYATLYGDMNGGFNPIKDLYKMEVYRLARWRNEHAPADGLGPRGTVIPERILTKAPTAELRPGQTDQDSLPPYEVLDDILACLVEGEMPLAAIVAKGHAPETVLKIDRLLRLAEYKRRQAAPGVKISSRSFGRERRYPITNKFREEIAAPPLAWPAKAGTRVTAPRADGGDAG